MENGVCSDTLLYPGARGSQEAWSWGGEHAWGRQDDRSPACPGLCSHSESGASVRACFGVMFADFISGWWLPRFEFTELVAVGWVQPQWSLSVVLGRCDYELQKAPLLRV